MNVAANIAGTRHITESCYQLLALALVFPVTVMCCPGFPGCFPESRPWVLSLGAVVIRHSLHVMSSVGRAQPGCP